MDMMELSSKIEVTELFDPSYDNDLFEISTVVENNGNLISSLSHQEETGQGIATTKKSVNAASDRKVEETELFDPEYDNDLIQACVMVENNENQSLSPSYQVQITSGETVLQSVDVSDRKNEDTKLFDPKYDNMLFQICAMVENHKNQSLSSSPSSHQVHTDQGGTLLKRSGDTINNVNSDAKKPRFQEASTSADTSVYKIQRNIAANKIYATDRVMSKTHKNSIKISLKSPQNVSVLQSAFGNRITSYKIKSTEQSDSVFQTPELFLKSIKNDVFFLIDKAIKNHVTIKINFILHADFMQETKNTTDSFDFQTCDVTLNETNDLNVFITILCDTLANQITDFVKKDNKWRLIKINDIDMNINKLNSIGGTSYIDLPKDIKDKKAVINVKNSDNACFKWALLSALYPVHKNSDRLSSYSAHSNKLKFDGVCFPVKLSDISKVEEQNNISVNVFGLKYDINLKKHCIVGPIYFTKCHRNTHVNLLYIQNGPVGHYCYVKNLSRLLSRQIYKRNGAVHICDGCLVSFTTRDRLIRHQQNNCSSVITNLPNSARTGYLNKLLVLRASRVKRQL